jgi:RNA polymerase sigma-70 factor, ECF subfamily
MDRIALERAVAELPLGYRTVFTLYYVEGYEHREIARMLGHSAGTSKSLLYKARRKLRSLLLQEYRPEQSLELKAN